MGIGWVTFAAGLALSFVNGANDNFKGVATLFGAGVSDYRRALGWGTLATALGAAASVALSAGLLAAFSGKGLVPDAIVQAPGFAPAAGLGAAITVGLATRLGFPISTTHALMGSLVGAGLVFARLSEQLGIPPATLAWSKLASSFVAPLLLSPIAALLVTLALYPALHGLRKALGVERDTCVCVGTEVVWTAPVGAERATAMALAPAELMVSSQAKCVERYGGKVLGVSADTLLGLGHFASAGWVSFARGMNDTPKIAAVLLGAGVVAGASATLTITAAAMAVGGLLAARRVATTMATKITPMNPGQGLTANLVTGLFVLLATKLSLPVSTTHVACGALFAIGLVTGHADRGTIRSIVLSWVTTLPVACACGAALAAVLAHR